VSGPAGCDQQAGVPGESRCRLATSLVAQLEGSVLFAKLFQDPTKVDAHWASCCACGVPRWDRASGARSACSFADEADDIRRLISGELAPDRAIATGVVEVLRGRSDLLDRFASTFHLAA
jgi:hypothetical protein